MPVVCITTGFGGYSNVSITTSSSSKFIERPESTAALHLVANGFMVLYRADVTTLRHRAERRNIAYRFEALRRQIGSDDCGLDASIRLRYQALANADFSSRSRAWQTCFHPQN
jgi:hypothetical protein